MKRHLRVFAALGLSLMSSAFVPSLKASESDKRTIITISQAVTVRGTTLPPGTYELKTQESSSTRNVILIFNAEDNRLITTVLAIPAYRLQPTDKSELSFYTSHIGQPAALHLWFYPGDNYGFEFLPGPQHTVETESGAGGD
jgi:hypothetical protein